MARATAAAMSVLLNSDAGIRTPVGDRPGKLINISGHLRESEGRLLRRGLALFRPGGVWWYALV